MHIGSLIKREVQAAPRVGGSHPYNCRGRTKHMSNDIALAKHVMLDHARHKKLTEWPGEDPAFDDKSALGTISCKTQISVEVVCRDRRSDIHERLTVMDAFR
jgi:hypothetical protein